MFNRDLTRTTPRHTSSSFPRQSSSSSSYFLLPEDLLRPPLPRFAWRSKNPALRARGGVFLAVFAKTANNDLNRFRPRRCLPRGSVFKTYVLKIKFILFFKILF